jgi:hypothetical protein
LIRQLTSLTADLLLLRSNASRACNGQISQKTSRPEQGALIQSAENVRRRLRRLA